jgi:hypothetical protein
MKKITNNVGLGKLAMLLDAVIAVCIIISVVLLIRFDKVNVQYQNTKPMYDAYVKDSLRLEQVIGDCQKKIDNAEEQKVILTAKIDSMKAEYKAIEKDRKVEKKVKDDLQNAIKFDEDQYNSFVAAITEDSTMQVCAGDTLKMNCVANADMIGKYTQLEQDSKGPRKAYNVVIMIAILLFIGKVVLFALWSFKNMKNVHAVSPWMEKSTKPMWAILGWCIPVYNLMKPCSVFSELWDETKYILKSKEIVADDEDENQMEFIGLWWGLHLFAKCILPLVVGGLMVCFNYWFLPIACTDFLNMGVFFGIKGFFLNLNHTFVAILVILAWLLYMGYEIYMINSYNKMNKMLVDNESKL